MLLSLAHKELPEDLVQDFTGLVGQLVTVDIEDGTIPEDESPESQTLFSGQVSRAELVYVPGALRLEVEAHSGSKGMDGLPRTRLFQDVTLGDLLDTVMEPYRGGALDVVEVNLGALANKQISFAAQWRENDWQFLLRVARKFGLFVLARDRNLYVNGLDPWNGLTGLGDTTDLKLGESLLSFRLGLSDRVAEAQGSSYQYFPQQGLGGGSSPEETHVWTGPSASPTPGNSLAQIAPDSARPPDGNIVEQDDYFSGQEFDAVAGRWGLANINDRVRGRGICDLPGIGLGSLLSLAENDAAGFTPLDGVNLMVTQERHSIIDDVYQLLFGCHADGSPPLLNPQKTGHEPDITLLSATVTDAEDPERIGRICAKILPFGDDLLSDEMWVRCLSDGSGDGHGTVNLPEVGDEVILSLDPRKFAAPLMLGSIYNAANKTILDNLPAHAGMDDGKLANNHAKYYLSKAGTCIIHDTTDGSARLIVATPNTSLILSEESPASFDLQVGGGACQIKGLDDGNLSITAKNITIEAEQELKVKSGTATKIEAGTDLELKGTSKVKVDAVNYEMKASATAKSEAGATHDIKGGASLKLTGAIININ